MTCRRNTLAVGLASLLLTAPAGYAAAARPAPGSAGSADSGVAVPAAVCTQQSFLEGDHYRPG